MTYDASAPPSQKWASEKVDYVLFSHLPIKAGETDAEIFWFDHRSEMGLQAGCYHACGQFTTARRSTIPSADGSARKDCSFSVDFQLAASDLDLLKPRPNAGPMEDDVTVPVKQCP